MRDTEKKLLPLPIGNWYHILKEPSFIKLFWPSKHSAVKLHFLKYSQMSSTLQIPLWLKRRSLGMGTVTGLFPGPKWWKNGRWDWRMLDSNWFFSVRQDSWHWNFHWVAIKCIKYQESNWLKNWHSNTFSLNKRSKVTFWQPEWPALSYIPLPSFL